MKTATLLMVVVFAGCAAPPRPELSELAERGREVYLLRSTPPCGTCHLLSDAGSRGTIGPDLDALRPDAERVLRAVEAGIGLMPPQSGILSPSEIEAVARYVEEAAGAAQ
jgi:sulfite dehydrogenase